MFFSEDVKYKNNLLLGDDEKKERVSSQKKF